ncbi:MAG: response regulator transcription factor [Anaerolineaceae bacterium]|jgi:DNA-binding response OmpR family regulator|nr:response regulator transcription factor [Anaerolineaceae bacterium]
MTIYKTPTANIGIDLDQVESVERQRVMVVEDESDTIFLLKQIFRIAGFNVVSAMDGEEALKKIVKYEPDMVLLDIMMPDMDGWETLKYIRQMTEVPVMFISALGRKQDVVRGFQAGVDDYVTKPFHSEELIERVRAVLRRAQKPKEISRFVFPQVGLIIDQMNQEVIFGEHTISLTQREFAVLAVLAKHAPAIVSYETIASEVWGEDETNAANARKRTKYLVYLLRRKFNDADPENNLIVNVDRLGYKLDTEQPED